jgi:hypothetical protein
LEPQPLKGLMVLLRWMCSVQLKIMWSWWSKSPSYCWTLPPLFWSDTLWHLSSSMSEADSWHQRQIFGDFMPLSRSYLRRCYSAIINLPGSHRRTIFDFEAIKELLANPKFSFW